MAPDITYACILFSQTQTKEVTKELISHLPALLKLLVLLKLHIVCLYLD